MTVNSREAPADVRAAAMMQGGQWIAYAGFVYIIAWLIGLAIGMATSSPGPTDSIPTIAAYFQSYREAAMIQATSRQRMVYVTGQ